MLHKELTVDGLDYVLQIGEAGDVALGLIGGNSRKGAVRKRDLYNLWPDEPILEDVDLAPNVFAVFRKAKEIKLEYLYRVRPWRISFYATTDRKIVVYRRMASRITRNLDGYDLIEALEGTFSLYRLAREAA